MAFQVYPFFKRGKELVLLMENSVKLDNVGINKSKTEEIEEKEIQELHIKEASIELIGNLLIKTYQQNIQNQKNNQYKIITKESPRLQKLNDLNNPTRKSSTTSILIDLTEDEDMDIELNAPMTRNASKRVLEKYNKNEKKRFKGEFFSINVNKHINRIFEQVQLNNQDYDKYHTPLIELSNSIDEFGDVLACLLAIFTNQKEGLEINLDSISEWKDKFEDLCHIKGEKNILNECSDINNNEKEELYEFIQERNNLNLSIYDWILDYLLILLGISNQYSSFYFNYYYNISSKIILCDLILYFSSSIYDFISTCFEKENYTEICFNICEILLSIQQNYNEYENQMQLSKGLMIDDILEFWLMHLDIKMELNDNLNSNTLVRYWWLKSWLFHYNKESTKELQAIKKIIQLKESDLNNTIKIKDFINNIKSDVNMDQLKERINNIKRNINLKLIEDGELSGDKIGIYYLQVLNQLKQFHELSLFKNKNKIISNDIDLLKEYGNLPELLLKMYDLKIFEQNNSLMDKNNSTHESSIFFSCYIGIEIEVYNLLELAFRNSKYIKIKKENDKKENIQFKQNKKDENDNSNEIIVQEILLILDKINKYITKIATIFENNQFSAKLLKTYLLSDQLIKIASMILLINYMSCTFMLHFDNEIFLQKDNQIIKSFLVKAWQFTAYSLILFNNNNNNQQLNETEVVNNPNSIDVINQTMDLLLDVHGEIGNKYLCDEENGLFPKLCLLFMELSKGSFEDEKHQCYYCLFHFPISTNSLYKQEHSKTPLSLDMKSALDVFNIVWNLIENKVSKGFQTIRDHRSILDNLKDFINLPNFNKHGDIAYNKSIIEAYFDKHLDLFNNKSFTNKNDILLCHGTLGNTCFILPEIYSKLYFALGRIQFYQYKMKFKQSAVIEEAEWEQTIDLFMKHLLICPKSIECWYYLGLSYFELAGGLVSRTATNIKFNGIKLGTLYKKSLACFSQVANLLNKYKVSETNPMLSKVHFFNEFGNALYCSAGYPMNMLPFTLYEKEVVKLIEPKDNDFLENEVNFKVTKIEVPTKSQVYKLAEVLFKAACSFEKPNWHTLMMIAKCNHKLKSPIKKVLGIVINSIKHSTNIRHHDFIVEPYYLLLSLAYKYLKNKRIGESILYSYLSKGFEKLNDIEEIRNLNNINREILIDTILKWLHKLKALDKKKWQHKLFYLEARILYFEKGDTKGAMDEMENIVRINTSPHMFLGIWKPEFERHGKHFVYVANYIKFMYELTIKLPQEDLMYKLLKRLSRVEISVYDFEKTWKMGQSYYIKIVRKRIFQRQSNITSLTISIDLFLKLVSPIEQKVIQLHKLNYNNEFSYQKEIQQMVKEYQQSFELYKLINNIKPMDSFETLVIDLYTNILEEFGFFEELSDYQKLNKNQMVDLTKLNVKLDKFKILKQMEKFNKELTIISKTNALHSLSQL
ncbi:hypothetical protein K502DRAFT_158732 [Neoconidiobolus thromboides FSU 785]|nr:hypothetical protein K502DRAFT_158732 [Neoconidiobolus thromboides FSU 785]